MVKVSQECLRAGDRITRAILALANTHHNNRTSHTSGRRQQKNSFRALGESFWGITSQHCKGRFPLLITQPSPCVSGIFFWTWKQRTILKALMDFFFYLFSVKSKTCICRNSALPHIQHPKLVVESGMAPTSELTLEYMAPLRTSPLRIQMMDAGGLALSVWQVRLRGSPARRLTTGPPLMTGFSGGTDTRKERTHLNQSTIILVYNTVETAQSGWYQYCVRDTPSFFTL